MSGRAGASEEVIRHHAEQHPCPAETNVREVDCPCGATRALVCDGCREPVFIAVRPGTWCEHAQQLMGDA